MSASSILAAYLTDVFRREVSVHAGSIPVPLIGLQSNSKSTSFFRKDAPSNSVRSTDHRGFSRSL